MLALQPVLEAGIGWCRRDSGASIEAQQLGHVRPLVAGANANFEGFSWLYATDPALGQDASVEQGVARPIGEFDASSTAKPRRWFWWPRPRPMSM